ncbi:hypothetical protein HHL19_36585 [Streptomyces sp. R302]|uniref:hypothetical protein n=1 Tax=unclassified Streptomyces TaxID=2593676 RepID=UPI00145E2D6F|nr:MULTISPECIES: hypothetical protein [unclassified Streptomyces]NML54823.1 hypothetical protein [Streptomyces sp. R301]NML84024.1 hypothetical protein [Streptomyces sp. R302]
MADPSGASGGFAESNDLFVLGGEAGQGLGAEVRELVDPPLRSGEPFFELDEIRSPAELTLPAVDLSEEEIERALTLLDSMTVEHLADLGDALTDHYTEALHEVIEAKAEDRAPRPVEGEAAPAGQVVDLMAALEASVAEARERRGEAPAAGGGGEEATVHELPRKKAPAKKAGAKKTTANKALAKKAASRRRKPA